MDADNKKDLVDRLTWLFGHARRQRLATACLKMWNYSRQEYFDEHPYVVNKPREKVLL